MWPYLLIWRNHYLIRKTVKNNKKNGNVTYYPLDIDVHWGIFSLIMCSLERIVCADKLGLVPYIYLDGSYSMFADDSYVEGDNAWEYYMQQPVKELPPQNKEIIEYTGELLYYRKKNRPMWTEFEKWSGNVPSYHKHFEKYIKLNSDIQESVDYWIDKLGIKEQRVLGVAIRVGYRRGYELKRSLFDGHPLVESCDYYEEQLESILKETGCDKIFLAIDDREWFEQLKERYGDRLVSIERSYLHYFANGGSNSNDDTVHAEYGCNGTKQRITEYLIETYVLSNCTSLFFTGGSQGVVAAILCNNKYETIINDSDELMRIGG